MTRRKTRKRMKIDISPFRSLFERTCSRVLPKCDYEPKDATLEYIKVGTYHPDFVPKSRNGIVFECKGRFRTSMEAAKYVAVRESNPEIRIIFIFMTPKTPMPNAKKRKDGTKMSHAEWADKNGFEWCVYKDIKREWLI